MAWRRSVVYATVMHDDELRFHYSPRPAIDATWWRTQGAKRIIPLHPPLPPAWADIVCRHLRSQDDSVRRTNASRIRWFRGSGKRHQEADIRRFAVRTRRFLAMVGYRWSAHVQAAVELQTKNFSWTNPSSIVLPSISPDSSMNDPIARWPSSADLRVLADLLDGRLLGELEALQLAERAGIELHCSVEDGLTALTLLGRLRRRPGLVRTPFGNWRCLRCGATESLAPWDCAACGESTCWMCEECRAIGVVRGCTLLYAGAGAELDVLEQDPDLKSLGVPSPTPPASTMPSFSTVSASTTTIGAAVAPAVTYRSHALTPAQLRAADALKQFVDTDTRRDALVWAVCGAGKTELCFPAVARVLGQGGRVLFAIPRRDVVQEIGQRLRTAFPTVAVQVLHGGSGRSELYTLGQGTLTVATTHQVLRFEQAFDLVVLDEVDAFPYRGSRMLHDAIENAVRPGGRIVRMSATPGRHLLDRADAGESVLITVPVRHHGRPLPVPVLHRDATLTHSPETFRPSALLLTLLAESLGAAPPSPVLVFVPDVAATERVGRALLRTWAGRGDDRAAARLPLRRGVRKTPAPRVLWSHARDSEREVKIRALQQGHCDVFVATSILERGITVPDVDVVVLFADSERVFSEAALVQMAGRVGRTVARPTGRVHFVGGRIGSAMKRAVQQIERLNEEAARLGLLKTEPADSPVLTKFARMTDRNNRNEQLVPRSLRR